MIARSIARSPFNNAIIFLRYEPPITRLTCLILPSFQSFVLPVTPPLDDEACDDRKATSNDNCIKANQYPER